MRGKSFALVILPVLCLSVATHVNAQMAPGTYADANHPAGAPDPEKLDDVWQVDPISGSVSVNIPFTTTPQGGRGPKIPFSLLYNSSSTVTLQGDTSQTITGIGYLIGVGSPGQTTVNFKWSPTPLNTPLYGPVGPWTTTGPFIYSSYQHIPDQVYTVNPGQSGQTTINDGNGCDINGPYIFTDENGGAHDMNLESSNAGPDSTQDAPPCYDAYTANLIYGSTSATTDGSAIKTTNLSVVDPDGTIASNAGLTDPNNNTVHVSTSGGVTTATDALGRTVYTTNIPVGSPGQIPIGTYYVKTYDQNGNPETYTVVFSSHTLGSFSMPHPTSAEIKSNFWCIPSITCPSGYSASSPSGSPAFPAISSISRPDGTSYTFQYDATYGTISKIIFPTGGYVRFSWAVLADAANFYGQFNAVSDIVVTDVYTSTGSGPESHWFYNIAATSGGVAPSSTVDAPDGSYTQYVGACFVYSAVPLFAFGGRPSCKEASRSIFTASGTLLKSVAKRFDSIGQTLQETSSLYDVSPPIQQLAQYAYDAFSNVTEKDESDFYNCSTNPCAIPTQSVSLAAPTGGWLRRTYIWYAHTTNQALLNAHIVNRRSQVTVTNGAGSPASLTTYGYDTHGNQTSENKCLSISGSGSNASCSSFWTTSYGYDTFGQLTQKIEGVGTSLAATTINTWTNGFITDVQHPNGAHDSYTYYPTGAVKTHTDWNLNVTNYSYSDPLNRIKTVTLPATMDGTTGSSGNGTTTYNYTDTPGAFSVQEQHTIDTTGTITSSTKTYDGLGREVKSLTVSPQCAAGIEVDTSYDLMGRVSSVTNPYCTTTNGSTGFQYDFLGRKTQTTLPDGATVTVSYAGNAIEATDPFNGTTNVQHVRQVDGLGRLTNVCEVTGSSLGSGSPSSCGLAIYASGYLTTYTYDPLGNMTGVNQHGLSRSFIYDTLSRLTSATNPEVGADLYSYSTLTTYCAPDESVPCTRTDARGVKTTYKYDSMSRLVSKAYSTVAGNTTGALADLSSCYQYDTALSAVTDANPKGQMTAEWQQTTCPTSAQTTIPSTAVGIRILSNHDAMGRVGLDQQCLNGSGCPSPTIGDFVYTYNLSGSQVQSNNGIKAGVVTANQVATFNATTISAPSATWKTTYDTAGHIVQAAVQDQPASGVWPTSKYLTAPTLLKAVSYDPFGHMTASQLAIPNGSSTAAISTSRNYDNRGRISSEVDNGSGATSSATHSLGTITITGSEQGPTYPVSSYATTSATINGTEQSGSFNTCPGNPHGPCMSTIFDAGTVSLTINGITVSTGYGNGSTSAAIALALKSAIQNSGAPTKATVSGSTISLRSTIPGTAGNSVTISGTSATNVTPYYTSPSFTAATSPFANGVNVPATIYDSGSVSATVNGITASASFGNGSTPQSVATALASAIQSAAGGVVTAKSDGDLNVLVSTGTGTSTDYAISTTVAFDNTDFTQPSFTAIAFTMQDGLAADLSSNGLIYYYFVPNGGYAPNGNILAHSDMVMGDWVFGYDAADRLTSAIPDGFAPSQYLGQYACWTYDAFGNRTLEAVSTINCSGSNPTPQVKAVYNSANNRVVSISGNYAANFVYDAAGNTLYDGANEYWYDAEGQMCAAQSMRFPGATAYQYIYDAGGARIGKTTLSTAPAPYTIFGSVVTSPTCAAPMSSGSTLSARYLVDQSGDQVTEFNGSGTWQHSNIWAGGKLVGTYDTKGVHFELTDPLGSKRVQANDQGQVDETCTSLPFGNDLNNPSSVNCVQTSNALLTNDDATEHHFTGKERDTESGNDYFFARYYASALGRFTTPDWSAKEDPVPYATFTDPQSLNLYAYARNNPITLVDLDGHNFITQSNQQWIIDHAITNPDAALMKAAGVHKLKPQQQSVPISKSTYKTATGAATAALDSVMRQSETSGWEYAGRIVRLANGKYAYTSPTTMKSDRKSDFDGGMPEGTRIPAGSTDAGMYHTHPTACKTCAHEQFSGADNAIAVREQLPSYIESGATRSIYMLPVRPSILDPTPPVVIRDGPPQ